MLPAPNEWRSSQVWCRVLMMDPGLFSRNLAAGLYGPSKPGPNGTVLVARLGVSAAARRYITDKQIAHAIAGLPSPPPDFLTDFGKRPPAMSPTEIHALVAAHGE